MPLPPHVKKNFPESGSSGRAVQESCSGTMCAACLKLKMKCFAECRKKAVLVREEGCCDAWNWRISSFGVFAFIDVVSVMAIHIAGSENGTGFNSKAMQRYWFLLHCSLRSWPFIVSRTI